MKSRTKSKEKITMEKYVVVAEQIRISKNYLLDISRYEPKEVEMIATMVQDDSIFCFFNQVKDIDVRKLKAIFEYLEAEEKMIDAKMRF